LILVTKNTGKRHVKTAKIPTVFADSILFKQRRYEGVKVPASAVIYLQI
jgi:hypothetical protein